MAHNNEDVIASIEQVIKLVAEWKAATSPNELIEGLDYEALTKIILLIPNQIDLCNETDLIRTANDIIESLEYPDLDYSTANREAIIVKSRLLAISSSLNNLTRVARKSGYYDPESPLVNASSPAAAVLKDDVLEELAEVKQSIDELREEFEKNNQSGVSVSFGMVSVDMATALTAAKKTVAIAHDYIVNNININAYGLQKKLNKVVIKAESINNAVQRNTKLFGNVVLSVSSNMNIAARKALRAGLRMIKASVEINPFADLKNYADAEKLLIDLFANSKKSYAIHWRTDKADVVGVNIDKRPFIHYLENKEWRMYTKLTLTFKHHRKTIFGAELSDDNSAQNLFNFVFELDDAQLAILEQVPQDDLLFLAMRVYELYKK